MNRWIEVVYRLTNDTVHTFEVPLPLDKEFTTVELRNYLYGLFDFSYPIKSCIFRPIQKFELPGESDASSEE